MILFILQCYLVSSQILMLDSRQEFTHGLKLSLFQKRFSTWVTYNKDPYLQDVGFFNIINNNYKVMEIQGQSTHLLIIFNDNQEFELYDEQLLNNKWIHFIIDNQMTSQNNILKIITPLNQKEYQFQIDSAPDFESQSLISLVKDYQSFCLIFDRESIELKPIIYSINLQQFITNKAIYLSTYYSDSAIEIFLKKIKSYQSETILQIFKTELEFIKVLYRDDQIQILENQIVRLVDSSQRQYNWFKLLFTFNFQNIYCEIQFADEKISQSFAEIPGHYIYFWINIYLYISNFKFMKVTTYFKTNQYEQFEGQQLKSFKNCDQNIRYYLDIYSNTCRDYLDLDQIQIIESNDDFDYIQMIKSKGLPIVFDSLFHFQNLLVGEAVARQVLANLTNQDIYQYPYYYEQDTQNYIKEPFILRRFKSYEICYQNYFGQNCKIFIKKCQKAQQNYCKNCIEGYLLIMNRCIKCPQNCLICILHQKQQKCLLPKPNYFLNKNQLIKFCEYEQCNSMGQQISNKQMMSKIEECFEDEKCLLKHCNQLHSQQRLGTQGCFSLEKESLQQTYRYISYLVRQDFYGQELLQFMLIQSFELYGNILMNEMISNYYLNVQMESYINKELKIMDFNAKEYYFQNFFILECEAKGYQSQGIASCIKHNKSGNKKCHNLPCFYKLEIRDILYYLGPKIYVAHDDFIYSSIIELLQSVQFVGLSFQKVYLKIYPIVYDYTQQDLLIDINFEDRTKIHQFLNTSIEIEINFNQQQTFQEYQFNVDIKANKIIIQDQSIANYLNIYLSADIIEIKRLILEKYSGFNFFDGVTALFEQIELRRFAQLNISNFRTVKIVNFSQPYGSCFTSQFRYIDQVYIQNFTSFNQQTCDKLHHIFKFYSISFILAQKLEFGFYQIKFPLIFAQRVDNIQIKDTSLVAEELDFMLFYIVQGGSIEFINQFFNITRVYNQGCIIIIIQTKKTTINKFSLISKFIEQFIVEISVSEQISLINFKIDMDFLHAMPLIHTISNGGLEIIGMRIFQNLNNNDMDFFLRKEYLLYHQQVTAKIKNIDLQGIRLVGGGLLYIDSIILAEIIRCTMRNITSKFKDDNKIFSLRGVIIYIHKLNISDFRINSLQEINFLEISSKKEIQIIECQVLNIQITTKLKNNYLFQIQGPSTRLIKFLIMECKYINLFQIQSSLTLISELECYDNTFQSIIQLKGINTKALMLEDSKLFILDQREILTQFETLKVQIFLFDIQIELKHVYQYFVLSGRHDLILKDVYIHQQTQESVSNYQYGIFKLQQSTLFVRSMGVLHLNQILFQIVDSQMIQIQDIILTNSETQSTQCLFYIYETPLLLEYVNLINIRNLEHIFYIETKKKIIIRNMLVYETKNVLNIFQIKSNASQELILFEDVIFVNILEGWVFHLGFNGKRKIKIDNIFINSSDNFLLSDKSNYIFILNKSMMRVINFNIDSQLFMLSQSEIFYNNLLKLPKTHFDKSYIFNNLKQSILNERRFSFTLSFNGVNLLKTIHLDKMEDDNYQKFLITQTGQSKYFFYVPSGQYISAYKQFNFASLQHEQVYHGLYLVVDGYLQGYIQQKMQCIQKQFYNDQVTEQEQYEFDIQQGINDLSKYMFIISPLNANYTVFKITCNSGNDGQIIQLQYNVKAFPCQLGGEFLYQNMCIECNLNQNLYSFKQNSNKCNQIDQSKIKQISKGILQLNPRYWRYKYTSDIIELCNSNYCNGGSIPGDRSCIQSRVGALCEECDLYNIRGDGSYTKSDQYCMECKSINFILMLKLFFSILWQLLLIVNGYYSNKKLSEQYLMFRIGFRQYYQILYRQSIDIPSIIIKMFTNYVFLLFIIKSNLNLIGYTFITNINIINNPNLITKAQIDCILSSVFQMDIIYSSFIFQIVQLFFIVTLTYVLYLLIISVKKIRFHLGLILFVTEGIIVYNLNVILNTSLNLLSYKVASGLKWVKYNIQYLFITETHMSMIQFIVPVTVLLMILPLLFPVGIKSLSVFNRQVKRIYALYYQEYNPSYVFWDYLILYTKYTIMIFSISDTFSKQYGIIIIFMILIQIFNLKPYYLQNLNQLECNLYFAYGIQLSLLSIDKFKDEIIVLLNLIIISKVGKIIYLSYSNFNRRRILSWKLKIISKILWADRILGIQKDQRQLKNRQDFIYLINTKILKKSQLAPTVNHALFQTEQEIEMPMIIKLVQKGAPQTRQEEIFN